MWTALTINPSESSFYLLIVLFLTGFNGQLDVLMLNITIRIHLFSKKQRK